MLTSQNIIKELSPHIFWDVDVSSIDLETNSLFVLQRVLQYGQMNDWLLVLNFYGAVKLKKIVTQINSLDQVSLSFLSNYFQIEKSKFKCYKKMLSNQDSWSY